MKENQSNQNINKNNKAQYKFKHIKLDRKRPRLSKLQNKDKIDNFKLSSSSSKNSINYKFAGGVKFNPKSKLSIIPLGGLDSIGKNMMVIKIDQEFILIDAGLMFPDDNHPGVDLILPDYTYVLENQDNLKAIIITHGHEDHIGCLPYLIKDLDVKVPIYASRLSIGLINSKFEEFGIKGYDFHQINNCLTVNISCIKVTFFKVCHSIPGSFGVFVQTPAGNILHTGDFKLDPNPIDGARLDFSLLKKFSSTGIDIMLSDSTNATINGTTKSESVVGPVLDSIIKKAKGMVVVACFASHVHRIQQIIDASVKNNKKVLITGRSMIQITQIARDLGYLKFRDEDVLDSYYTKNIDRQNAVVICTGSQGEPLSALSRIANGAHKHITLKKGDCAIISATPVPGNEKAVGKVINMLAKIGVEIFEKDRTCVHVSGHSSRDELKKIIKLCKPRAFMPIHGETYFLYAHSKLAQNCGISSDNIFVCENGNILELNNHKIKIAGSIDTGLIYVDGLSVGDTTQDVLTERNFMSSNGVVFLSVAINFRSYRIQGDVNLHLRGVSGGDEVYFQHELKNWVVKSINNSLKKHLSYNTIKSNIKSSLMSLLWDKTKQKPLSIIDIIDI